MCEIDGLIVVLIQKERIVESFHGKIEVIWEFIGGEDGEGDGEERESVEQEAKDDDRVQLVEEQIFLVWQQGKSHIHASFVSQRRRRNL